MAKPKNSFEELARKANERTAKVRASGEQLRLLPDEQGIPIEDVAQNKVGRPKGAQNKGSSELRKWLAAQGYRMPEDVLAQMAGLDSADPVIVQAIERTEQLLAWAFADAFYKKPGEKKVPREPSPEQRLSLVTSMMVIMERAASAVLPYGAAKASPDVAVQQNVQVIMPAQPDQARDVTPQIRGRMVPADVAHKNEQNQQVTDSENTQSDTESRTK